MKRRVEIFTYWTLEADLASVFSAVSEFVKGDGYDVELDFPQYGRVSIYVVDETDGKYLAIDSDNKGEFLDSIIGRVSIEMAKHSEVHLHVVDRVL